MWWFWAIHAKEFLKSWVHMQNKVVMGIQLLLASVSLSRYPFFISGFPHEVLLLFQGLSGWVAGAKCCSTLNSTSAKCGMGVLRMDLGQVEEQRIREKSSTPQAALCKKRAITAPHLLFIITSEHPWEATELFRDPHRRGTWCFCSTTEFLKGDGRSG